MSSTQPERKVSSRKARQAERNKGPVSAPSIVPRSAKQAALLQHLKKGASVFALGASGGGKTYLPTRYGAQQLLTNNIDKLVVCRINVSKRKFASGFLPGKLDQKLAPWMAPIMDALRDEVSAAQIEKWKNEGRFEIASFEHMRGRTFNNSFVILDEAQNADFADLQLFLTRIGEHAQCVVTGDLDQIDDVPDSGLFDTVKLGIEAGVPMETVVFTEDECVRSEFAGAWVKAYKQHARQRGGAPSDKILDLLPEKLVQVPQFLTQ